MPILTTEMKRVIAEQKLGFMVTVCADGTPNLSPKGQTYALDDDHLVIGEVRSPQTRANLETQPVAEINVIDTISRKGFRFKGPCEVVSDGARLDELRRFLKDKGTITVARAIFVMTVESALPLISPAYDYGTTEDDIRRTWKQRMDDLNSDL